jgi:hypothetical protein
MKVNDFRICYAAVEGVPEQMSHDCGRLGGLVRASTYATLFKQVLEADGDALVTTPWPYELGLPTPRRNHYWSAYVADEIRNHQGRNAGDIAFRAVVPLRRKQSLVRFDWPHRAFVEGWYYPHGVATTITAWFLGAFDPKEMKAAADAFTFEPLTLTWSDPSRNLPGSLTLGQLAETVLGELRREAFDSADGTGGIPFTTVTVVRATAEPSDKASASAAFVDTALSLAGIQRDGKTAPDRAIYAQSHGRVVWREDYAVEADGKRHALGCLHRNVAIATMQTASLVQAATQLAAVGDRKGALDARIEPFGRVVAGLVARVYGGATWAPPFLRDQIKDANEHGSISGLRTLCNMTPLQ